MSGGGIFDQDGSLVAIHGQGDRYTAHTEKVEYNRRENNAISDVGSYFYLPVRVGLGIKTGYNRGIGLRSILAGLSTQGIELENLSSAVLEPITGSLLRDDEYFIRGLNLLIAPGSNTREPKSKAVEFFSQAVLINPRNEMAYFLRGYTYNQLGKEQKSLDDYNKVIVLNPKVFGAYNNRALLRQKLQDFRGALADYNRAIAINPKFSGAYNNRALLKETLSDFQGALADYNQAIDINPKFSGAYSNRATLKYKILRNKTSAIVDILQAAKLEKVVLKKPQITLEILAKLPPFNSVAMDLEISTEGRDTTKTFGYLHYFSENKFLHVNIEIGEMEIVKLLLESGANPNLMSEDWGLTPLKHSIIALRHGGLKMIEVLINYGAKVNGRDNRGYTPLMVAAVPVGTAYEELQIEVMKLLIRKGAKINARSDDGETPLVIARLYKLEKMVTFLVNAGAKS
jgi:tetratricopeptide (TPR) repeat protein